MVKDDHTTVEHGMIGYAAFGKYFLNYSNKRCAEFPLLAGVENASLLSRYRALMGTWRQVKDHTGVSGTGGLLGALVEFGLSQSLWNATPRKQNLSFATPPRRLDQLRRLEDVFAV
ncbi:hypothetical protein MJO28_004989 [Puccinia striiformis f. sp. tritici]|uniref:Uncharacterized protein n=1 Tax=Puccinia striiformis f. sp. tritici TaxID=168172 RepID=A0ACC0EK61_9BASI|nr:hypothetical protein MJO28_004989 [Puccinia striiformis f. sp. tritici]